MSNYFRGWKGSSSRNPYFQKLDKKSIIRPRGKGLFGKILRGIFFILAWPFGKKGLWKKALSLALMLGLFGFVFFGILFAYYSFTLPDPDKLLARVVPESTKIFDRHNELLYEIHGEAKRTLVELDQVPDHTKQAAIAIEDKDFYKHGGISITGIVRSAIKNVFTGSRVGGSTITQQFIRNAVLTREKTYTRKLKEVILSMQLERKYTKDEILKLYLNEIPYGSNSYGVQAAAQTFFGKSAKDLTLAESAYLAAMPQAPTFYSPFGPHKEDLDLRADTVLRLMAEQGYITDAEKREAQATKVAFRDIGRGILAPHFVLYVQDLLAEKYGEIELQEGGFRVTTTLDLALQKIAEEAVARQVAINEKSVSANNASLVAVDPKTGQILAMVGSRDYFDKEHDGAVNVALRPRQPGSSFKPYVYAAAFKNGMNPATLLLDVTTNFGKYGGRDYTPQNYDGQNHGPVNIRKALAGSLNIPAVKTLILTGIDEAIDMAEKMGLTTFRDRSRFGPSIVLGGGEVKLLEHVSAFGVFANGGIRQELAPILKIENSRGQVLEEFRASKGREVLDPQIAYQISDILSDNEARAFVFGRGSRLTLPGRPVAVKTGTTQEYHDAWTVGYTPNLAAGVWVGNNDNKAMKIRADGSQVAAPIWNEFMRRALEGRPAEQFARPQGIEEITVDALSGKLPTQYTPSTRVEIFSSFNAPDEADDVHVPAAINGETKVYSILHSEKPDDPAWEEPVRAWAASHGYPYPPEGGDGTPAGGDDISIKIAAPDKIASLPWKAGIETDENLSEVVFLLDGKVLATASSAPFEYAGRVSRVDGAHTLTAQVKTKSGKSASVARMVEFALGQALLLLDPADNEVLKLPANLVLETNLGAAADDVKFYMRSTSGEENQITGQIFKQQLAGKVQMFTLNWPEVKSPPSGSYAIYSRIGLNLTQEIVIKIP